MNTVPQSGHRPRNRFAGKMRTQIRQQLYSALLTYLQGVRSNVWKHHDMLHPDQLRGYSRLVPENVESRACDLPVSECCKQRRLVDNRAACNIDEEPFRPQRIQDALGPEGFLIN